MEVTLKIDTEKFDKVVEIFANLSDLSDSAAGFKIKELLKDEATSLMRHRLELLGTGFSDELTKKTAYEKEQEERISKLFGKKEKQ